MKSVLMSLALVFSFAFADAAPVQIEARHGRGDHGRGDDRRGDYGREDYGQEDYGRGDHRRGDYERERRRDRRYDRRRDHGHRRDYDRDHRRDHDRDYRRGPGRDHGPGYGRDQDRQDQYGPGYYGLPHGSYVNSCHSCNVGPQVMTCICSNSRRQLFTTSIYYNLCRSIGNFHGQLACE